MSEKHTIKTVREAFENGAELANPYIRPTDVKKLWDNYNREFIKGEMSVEQITGIDFKFTDAL